MILGVDVGGTNIDIVVFENNKFKHVATYSTKKDFSRLNEILNKLIKDLNIKKIGIGIAGWIKKGKIIKAPNLPFYNINFDLKAPFFMDNDANCFALYSAKHFGCKTLIGITVGTGIGTGIVINGKIFKGEGLAGEIGHWVIGGNKICKCGGIGHLECYFSGWIIEEKFGRKVIELFKTGEIYKIEGFRVFCIAVANAITLLDPEAVVFGGRIGGNINVEKLKNEIYRYLMDGFEPKIFTLNDPLAVAKGACFLTL